jgi:hypothetical protein
MIDRATPPSVKARAHIDLREQVPEQLAADQTADLYLQDDMQVQVCLRELK